MTSKPVAALAVSTLVVLAACGGGSDGDAGAGTSAETTGDVAVVSFAGTIEPLVGDLAPVDYTINVPAGFTLSEFGSASSPKLEDPDVEFGERTTDVGLLFLPEADTAQGLVDSSLSVNSAISVTAQADEEGFAWFTFTTPSVSSEGEIAFGSAQSSLTLPDGSSLQCRAATQHAIDEEWSEAEAAAVADQMLEICRTLRAG